LLRFVFLALFPLPLLRLFHFCHPLDTLLPCADINVGIECNSYLARLLPASFFYTTFSSSPPLAPFSSLEARLYFAVVEMELVRSFSDTAIYDTNALQFARFDD